MTDVQAASDLTATNRLQYYRNYNASHRQQRRDYMKKRYWSKRAELKAKQDAWRKTTHGREVTNALNRKVGAKARWMVLSHYGGIPPKCACCDSTEEIFLTVDHIKGGGNQHRKAGLHGRHFYAWLVRNGYPPGYQILCHNCNWAKSRGGCPHQRKALPVDRNLIAPAIGGTWLG